MVWVAGIIIISLDVLTNININIIIVVCRGVEMCGAVCNGVHMCVELYGRV